MTRSYRARSCATTAAAIAFVALSASGCTTLKRLTYEGLNRDRWQQPDRVVRALELQPGQRVADLGAGSGYFTFRLADAVGPEGRVYGVDVDKPMNDYLRGLVKERGYANVEVIDAKYEDPLIPGDGVDLIFLCDTYHHIDGREAYFRNAARYLREGGRIAVVDFKPEQWLLRLLGHTMARDEMVREMQASGYRLAAEHDFLWRHYFLIFTVGPPPDAAGGCGGSSGGPACGLPPGRPASVPGRTAPAPSVIYTCSMHPSVRLATPGNCPTCGMTLVEKK